MTRDSGVGRMGREGRFGIGAGTAWIRGDPREQEIGEKWWERKKRAKSQSPLRERHLQVRKTPFPPYKIEASRHGKSKNIPFTIILSAPSAASGYPNALAPSSAQAAPRSANQLSSHPLNIQIYLQLTQLQGLQQVEPSASPAQPNPFVLSGARIAKPPYAVKETEPHIWEKRISDK
jgi:hypothetical protein